MNFLKNIFSLLFVVLFSISSLFAEGLVVESKKATEIDISIKNSKKEYFLIVIRQAKTAAVAPKNGTNYIPSDSIKPVTTNNTGLDNKVIYSGNEKIINATAKFLLPSSSYSFDVYKYTLKKGKAEYGKLEETKPCATMAYKPTVEASGIAFYKQKDSNKISLSWKRGNGKYCLVLCREGAEPEYPKDGTTLKANLKFGDANCLIPGTNTYVLFSSLNNQLTRVNAEGFNTGISYYFAVVEANGQGESVSYLPPGKENMYNPRSTSSKFSPPKALPATEISKTAENVDFVLNWTNVPFAVSYELDISENFDFSTHFDKYIPFNVGNVTSYKVVGGVPNAEYFYRVRANTKSGTTEWSNVMMISLQ
ncbi:MAG: fibronectin type III domain-containing protein [Bacteroidota bacterium]